MVRYGCVWVDRARKFRVQSALTIYKDKHTRLLAAPNQTELMKRVRDLETYPRAR